MLTSFLNRRKPAANSKKPHWKSHISTRYELPPELVTWLCFELIKTKDDATGTDDIKWFVSDNTDLKNQGDGFNPMRLKSGQTIAMYCVEANLEGAQVYASKDANKVGPTCIL